MQPWKRSRVVPADGGKAFPNGMYMRELEHTATVYAIAFSSDGKVIASGGRDKKVVMRDVATGETIRELEHTAMVLAIAFSSDGKVIASGGKDKKVVMRDVATGETIRELEHTATVYAIAFSSDGKVIASGGVDKKVVMRDVATGETIRELEHTAKVYAIAFSSDGKVIASGGEDRKVVMRDVATGESIRELERTAVVYAIAFSSDGKVIASGGRDNKVVMRDVATGETIRELEHTDTVLDIAFSSDGKVIASGGSDKKVVMRDVATGETIRELEHTDTVDAIAFSSDGKVIASGGADKKVVMRDVATGETIRKLEHTAMVLAIAFSSDGKVIASGGGDKKVVMRDVATGETIRELEHTATVDAIAFSSDGKVIASGGSDKKVVMRDVATGETIRELEHTAMVLAIAFSSDGKVMASGGEDKKVVMRDVATGETIRELEHTSGVRAIAFSSDGKVIASGGADKKVVMRDVATGETIRELEHTAIVFAIAFSSDGKVIASGGKDNKVVMRDAATGETIRELEHTASVFAIAFSSDGKVIASGGGDKKVVLRDVATGETIRELERTAVVYAIAFSSDGKVIASGGEDRKVVMRDATPHPCSSAVCFWVDAEPYHLAHALRCGCNLVLDTLLYSKVPSSKRSLLATLVAKAESESVLKVCEAAVLDPLLASRIAHLVLAGDADGKSALDHAIDAAQPGVVGALLHVALSLRFSRTKMRGFLREACARFPRYYAYTVAPRLLDDYPSTFDSRPNVHRAPINALQLNNGSMALVTSECDWFATQEQLWSKLLNDSDGEKVDVRCGFIGLPGLVDAPSTFEQPSLFKAYVQVFDRERTADFSLIMSEPFQASVAFKWGAYGQRMWRNNLILYLLTFVCYELGASMVLPLLLQTAATSPVQRSSGTIDVWKESTLRVAVALGLLAMASLLALGQLWGEVKQLRHGGAREYFASAWNTTDICFSLALPGAAVFLAICTIPGAVLFVPSSEDVLDDPPPATSLLLLAKHLTAAGTMLLLLRAKKAVRGLQKTSSLLSLLQESVLDMRSFLGILLTVCLAQALTLWHLQFAASLTATALLDAFRFGIGAPNDDYYASEWFSALWVLYVVWSLFILIVMLNALIAILGDTYDRVMEHQIPRGLLERARLLLELEQQMNSKQRQSKAFFPPFVHALVRVEEKAGEEEEWHGRMAAIKTQIKSVQGEMKEMKDSMQGEMKEMKGEMKSIQGEMKEMKDMLKELVEQNRATQLPTDRMKPADHATD